MLKMCNLTRVFSSYAEEVPERMSRTVPVNLGILLLPGVITLLWVRIAGSFNHP